MLKIIAMQRFLFFGCGGTMEMLFTEGTFFGFGFGTMAAFCKIRRWIWKEDRNHVWCHKAKGCFWCSIVDLLASMTPAKRMSSEVQCDGMLNPELENAQLSSTKMTKQFKIE